MELVQIAARHGLGIAQGDQARRHPVEAGQHAILIARQKGLQYRLMLAEAAFAEGRDAMQKNEEFCYEGLRKVDMRLSEAEFEVWVGVYIKSKWFMLCAVN